MNKKISYILLICLIILSTICVFGNSQSSVFDFEDDDVASFWKLTEATEDSYIRIEAKDGNKFLQMQGFTELISERSLELPYEFSLDAQIVVQGEIGFFVRASATVEKFNPHFDGHMMLRLYEEDWYRESGGKENLVNSLGANGLYIQIKEKKIRLYVKTYMEDGLKIGSQYYEFPLPDGVDTKEFVNLKFVDDGDKIEIFVNQGLLAIVEMSEVGYYDDDLEDRNQYFTKALIKDGEGNVLLDIENARIASEEAYVGVGNRNMRVNVDNIRIIETKKTDQTASPSPSPEDKTKEPVITQTPTKTTETKETDKSSSLVWILLVAVISTAIAAIVIVIVMKRRD